MILQSIILAYGIVELHQEAIPGHDMGIESVSKALVDGHGDRAIQLAQPRLVYRLLINIIRADSS